MFRTSNPALKNDAFRPAQSWDDFESQGRSVPGVRFGSSVSDADIKAARPASVGAGFMTIQGTVNKSFFLLALVVATALVGWKLILENPGVGVLVMLGGAVGGLISGVVMCFAPRTSPIAAPIYALFEGLFVGGVSAVYAQYAGSHPQMSIKKMDVTLNTGLIFNAVLLTFGITASTLAAYSFKIIRPGKTFYNVTIAATIGLCFYGIIAMVAAMFFKAPSMASVYDPSNGGMLSLLFSGFVLLLGAANLVLDFDVVNNGVKNKAPKYMEWYGSYAIMVTLVWVYLESLRMLSKLQSRK